MTRAVDVTRQLLAVERERDQLREQVCRLRDKLLELAKDCDDCDGTGLQTIYGETEDCPACHDIRELLA